MCERPEEDQAGPRRWSIGGWSGITDDGEAAERAAFNEKAEQLRIESGVLWRAELEALGPGKV